ncbi:MAG: ribosome maturation factor RimM [Chloroflexota bacterium]|jgi:16S rRNA processing protein RimM|nr:ribosome maturation factor RimM [Chloroflexota bacterium]
MPRQNENNAGSHSSREPAFLVLGKLRRAHGVRGEIPLEVYTQLLELLVPESVVYVGEEHNPYTIEKTRWKQDLLLLKFYEIDNRTIVSQLTNELVFVKTEQLPELPEGEFFYHELIGLDVYQQDGEYMGELTQILETGANDVYLIQAENDQEILIPATEAMILEIDPELGKMIVAKMEWYGE